MEDGILKMDIKYGGVAKYSNNKFSYSGGVWVRDLSVDPDLLTWSIFEDFIVDRGIKKKVEQVWYKLPSELLAYSRSIFENKDAEIRKLCEETEKVGRVELFIVYADEDEKIDDDKSDAEKCVVEDDYKSDDDNRDEESDDDNRDEESDDEKRNEESDDDKRDEESEDEEVTDKQQKENADGNQSEDEEHILGEGAIDHRFSNLMEQAYIADATRHPYPPKASQDDSDSDSEDDRPAGGVEYPDSPVDTDEEWANFHKEDKRDKRKKRDESLRSRADYEKPPYLWLMQTFNNADEFRDQLLRYVLKTQYDIKLNRWESTKQAAVCTHPTCKWRIYCSVERPLRKWMVKVYEDVHNPLPTGRCRMLKQGTIAKLFKEEARKRPEIRSTDIKDELMRDYNVSVSIYKCRKARRIALDMVLETQREQFAKLWNYEAELVRSNEDCSTEVVTVEKDGKQIFDAFYVCFEPLRTTWKRFCRPLIGLDGAFLKWELKGEILSAVGRDAENRIYPIAWAVVRGVNKETWEWFMKKIHKDLDLKDGEGYSLISDRQKGLKIAIASVLPKAEHRNCARHVYANWKKTYRSDDYRPFFWNVAYSRSREEFDLPMKELEVFDRDAHDALKASEPESWCRAYFRMTAKSADVCNNLSESFNRTIKKARELPLINMLETVRRLAMMRIARRFKKEKRCLLPFPKKIEDIMERNREVSKGCSVIISSDNLFEVLLYGCGYTVSLRLKTYVCREWDLTGIPCPHAIYVINDNHQEPDDHVDAFYKTSVWIETYRENIKPVNGEMYWPKIDKDPIGVPGFRKIPGRRKKKRIKAAHESPSKPNRVTRDGRRMTCGNCKQTGHNRLTCKNPAYVVEGPKRKRGRPWKTPVSYELMLVRPFICTIVNACSSALHVDTETVARTPKRPKKATTKPARTLSQPVATSSNATVDSTYPVSSTYPSSSTVMEASTAAPQKRGRGRPRGRGGARREVIPRGHGIYISPFTNKVFDVCGDKARIVGSSKK